jgi:hypothetical protein
LVALPSDKGEWRDARWHWPDLERCQEHMNMMHLLCEHGG